MSSSSAQAPSDARYTFSELVFSDYQRYRATERPNWLSVLARCVVLPGMIASIILRAQQCLYRSGHVRAANVMRTVGLVLVGADFVPGMQIGKGLLMPHPAGVVIGNGMVIGDYVTFGGGVTGGVRQPDAQPDQEYPTISDGAIVLANAVLVGGVRIGRHAQVGANTVVLSDVPDYAVVFGVPARKVGTREENPDLLRGV
jgi:serine O-acetyltransferase